MNYCVPDFDMEDEFSTPSSSTIAKHKAEDGDDDDDDELLWQDGQVILHSQTHRSIQKFRPFKSTAAPPPQPSQPLPPPQTAANYIEEDEMATWLHYPLDDLYTGLLYPTSAPSPPPTTENRFSTAVPPPQTPSRPPVSPQSAPRNFQLFSRLGGRPALERLTVVDSNDTPSPAAPASAVPATSSPSAVAAVRREDPARGGGASLIRQGGSGDMTVSSSPSASGSGGATTGTAGETAVEGGEAVRKHEVEERKRKGQETDEGAATTTGCQSEVIELESADEKKHSRGSTATKRSRAAEVHNLSERRRRDRINEKMRALQELIPCCNKSDKASMLDEAIEYLKSLQMQVQMMSMGYGMVPVMYPTMQQQYMPPMGMRVGVGMGMDMALTRPVMPFPSAVPGSALPTTPPGSLLPTSAAAATIAAPQLAPRLPMPAFPMAPDPGPGLSMMQASNQADSSHSSFPPQGTYGLPQLPNLGYPYQQYMALQQMQMQMQMHQIQGLQNQSHLQPGSSKPSTSKSDEENDDR